MGPHRKQGQGLGDYSWLISPDIYHISQRSRSKEMDRVGHLFVHEKSVEIQGLSLVGTQAQTKLSGSPQKCGIKGRVWDG